MPPLIPSEFCAALAPGRIELTRRAYGLRHRVEAWRRADLSPAGGEGDCWRFVVDALASILEAEVPARSRLKVVLSSHWIRFLVLPGNPHIDTPDEFAGYARQCFERVHGDAAKDWEIRADPARAGHGRMACAIDRELLLGIAAVTREAGCRLIGVQPYLMHAFNPLASPLGRQRFLFVLAEPGRVTLAAADKGGWTSARNCPLAAGGESLQALVARELQLLGDEEPRSIIVHAPRIAADDLCEIEAAGARIVPAVGGADYAMAWGTREG